MWWIIWSLIIVGTLAAFFLLGRHLWVKIKIFLHQLEQTAQLARRLGELSAQLEAAKESPDAFQPHVVATAEQRQAWRQKRVLLQASKSARRTARLDKTLARWRSIGIPF